MQRAQAQRTRQDMPGSARSHKHATGKAAHPTAGCRQSCPRSRHPPRSCRRPAAPRAPRSSWSPRSCGREGGHRVGGMHWKGTNSSRPSGAAAAAAAATAAAGQQQLRDLAPLSQHRLDVLRSGASAVQCKGAHARQMPPRSTNLDSPKSMARRLPALSSPSRSSRKFSGFRSAWGEGRGQGSARSRQA